MPPGQPAREEHQQRGVPLQAVCETVLDVAPISAHLPLARAELNHEAMCDCRRDWKYSLAVGKGQEQILVSRERSGAHSPNPHYEPRPFKEEAKDMRACQQRKGGWAGRQAGSPCCWYCPAESPLQASLECWLHLAPLSDHDPFPGQRQGTRFVHEPQKLLESLPSTHCFSHTHDPWFKGIMIASLGQVLKLG